MKINFLFKLVLLVVISSIVSCSKNKVKTVQYDLTGTFTGKLTLFFTDENGTLQSINGVDLPFSKTIEVTDNVSIMKFYAITTSSFTGNQFETLHIKRTSKNNKGKVLFNNSENNYSAYDNGEIITDTLEINL